MTQNLPPDGSAAYGVAAPKNTAPVLAGWICLSLCWFLFLVPIPFCGLSTILGWALNLAGLILAIIVMSKGRTTPGIIQLVCAIVVSPILFGIGIFFTAATTLNSAGKAIAESAAAQQKYAAEQQQASQQKATADLNGLAKALNGYMGTHNAQPPATADGLATLVSDHDLPSLPMDPWGRPYVYRATGMSNQPFELSSSGPNGIPGDADDIRWIKSSN